MTTLPATNISSMIRHVKAHRFSTPPQMLASDLSRHCQSLAHPALLPTILALALLLGILVSYLPQHLKIVRHRTSDGLSPWWVLLGTLSSTAALGNIVSLPSSRRDVSCCSENGFGPWACVAASLGVAQISVQFTCFSIITLLFLIYFPPATPPSVDLASLSSAPPPKRRNALIVAISTSLWLALITSVTVSLVVAHPAYTQAWADIQGAISGMLSAIQYFPQIWYTYRLRSIKSLSIGTMLIQVPGAFIFAFSLWLRVGFEGWSTWLVYIITGVLQSCLLGLAVTFYLADERAKKIEQSVRDCDDVDGTADEPDEWTGLLPKSRPINGRSRGSQNGTARSGSQRQLSMLYAATPPEHDSDGRVSDDS